MMRDLSYLRFLTQTRCALVQVSVLLTPVMDSAVCCASLPSLCVSRWGFLSRENSPSLCFSLSKPVSFILQQTAVLGQYWSDHLCVCAVLQYWFSSAALRRCH